jgi:antitoxin (DNA-binding transcriptional repressor) of toxin-antitoxin stability system
MKTIGIFEAKTHFTALCDEVLRTGQPTMVSKRGKPWVLVTPVSPDADGERQGILSSWMQWENDHPDGEDEPDFPDVRQLHSRPKSNPLED